MSAFSKILQASAARKPAACVMLPPDAFADDWADKPSEPVEIGLRRLAEVDVQAAAEQASRSVEKLYRDKTGACHDVAERDRAWNDALVRWAVARGTCHPDDATASYFPAAEDTIALALTSEGIRWLWDELVRLHKGIGSPYPPITDPEVDTLAILLARGVALAELSRLKQIEIRKLLAYVAGELAPLDPGAGVVADEDDDTEPKEDEPLDHG